MLNAKEIVAKIEQSGMATEAKRILIDVIDGCIEANGENSGRLFKVF